MASPDVLSRPRGLRLLLAALAGLVLVFGGTCGAGPTDLSLLAVSGPPTPSPEDSRGGQVPVPAAAEVAAPARRQLLRRAVGRVRRRLARTRRVRTTWAVEVVTRRGPPPLRGPPLLVA